MRLELLKQQARKINIFLHLLEQLLNNCDNSIMGIRNQVLLRQGYETMRRRSELYAFKFQDIDYAPNGRPIIRLNFLNTDQYGMGKVLPISEELLGLLNQWKGIAGNQAIS